MLWNESSRKVGILGAEFSHSHKWPQTRSGTVFAAWLPQVTAFSATHFDFVLPLSCAVNAEGDDQDDHEPDDADELNQVDEEWPPNPLNDIDEDWPPRDPFNDVDDVPPPPLLKRCRSASYDDCVATGTPLSGPHCRRAAKRRRNIEREGHIPRESTIRDHVASAEPIIVPSFDASTLPTALGAYAARTENKAKKFGSKKRCSLAELLGLSFQLITWNGMCVLCPPFFPPHRLTCIPATPFPW
jgi:hypothetical protein